MAVGVERKDCRLFFDCEKTGPQIADKYVVLAPGRTAWTGRNWFPDRFSEVAKFIRSVGFKVVAVGDANDANCRVDNIDIDLRGRTTLYQSANVIKNASAFAGIDSLPMWIAQTFDVPGVAFFGCVRPELRIVSPLMHGISDHDLPCIGCHHLQPPPAVGTSHCRIGKTWCEENVTAEMFVEKIRPMLAS
jgi:ADP-heptose:LPS heptosyltransferase